MSYTITLNKQMLDVVMKALGELPLKEAMPVFTDINNQFIEQTKKEKENENREG